MIPGELSIGKSFRRLRYSNREVKAAVITLDFKGTKY